MGSGSRAARAVVSTGEASASSSSIGHMAARTLNEKCIMIPEGDKPKKKKGERWGKNASKSSGVL